MNGTNDGTINPRRCANSLLESKVGMPSVEVERPSEAASHKSLESPMSGGRGQERKNTYDEPVSRITSKDIAGVPTAIEP